MKQPPKIIAFVPALREHELDTLGKKIKATGERLAAVKKKIIPSLPYLK